MVTNGQLDYYSHARSSTLHCPSLAKTAADIISIQPSSSTSCRWSQRKPPGGLSAERGPAGSPDTCLLQVDLGHAAVYAAMPLGLNLLPIVRH